MNPQLSKALRLSKIAFMASVCLWTSLVAINNVMDYGANYKFVEHVFEMDTTFPGDPLLWRSLRSQSLHQVAYLCIIAVEFTVGALSGIAVVRMLAAGGDPERFARAKAIGVMAVTLGVLLWLAGVEGIGAEYFLMWESHTWNGQGRVSLRRAMCAGALASGPA